MRLPPKVSYANVPYYKYSWYDGYECSNRNYDCIKLTK